MNWMMLELCVRVRSEKITALLHYYIPPPASSTQYAECVNGDVRLADFTDDQTSRQGTLQICINNAWGAVCSDPRFGVAEAQVACQQAGGYSRDDAEEVESVSSSRAVFLSEVNCEGNEARLLECPRFSSIGSACSSGEDVMLRCTGTLNRFSCIRPFDFLKRYQ